MIEILKNIKTVSFSYMSIIVLLFFAVLQSDQAIYDSAISQLRQIVKISAGHDENAMIGLIDGKLPGPVEKKTKNFLVEQLNIVVSFHYTSFELDYEVLKGKFEIDFDGFDFGRRNIDRLPTNFTKVTRVKYFLGGLPAPRNITSYEKLHNETLSDLIIPVLTPDFSLSRFEIFQVKTDTYNLIEDASTREYEGYKILDGLSLYHTDDEHSLVCNMRIVMTVTNKKYAYICDIGNVAFGDIEYSGGRIIIPAKDSPVVIKQRELKSLYSIPKDRQIPFNVGYRELYETTRAYSDLSFAKVEAILESEKSRNPSKLTILGAEISVPILTKTVFPILIIICLYMYLHLREVGNRVEAWSDSEIDVPWIGIYEGAQNQYAVLIQMLVFPAALMGLIYLKSHHDADLVISFVFFVVLIIVNLLNCVVIRKIRKELRIMRRVGD